MHQSSILAASAHHDHVGDGQHQRHLLPARFSPPTITGLPPFCRVTATLTPSSDSTIKIEVWLPETTWNGRFLGTGGGGFQGVITYSELAAGIQAGFASTNSDLGTGHRGCNPLFCGSAGNMGNPLATAFGDPAAPSTGLFGHPERIKDFGFRAIHLMTVRGKEIANAFYGQKAQRAYFAGCSTGGQNALMEAQRFPDDYDGILAGAAAFNRTHLHMAGLSAWQNTQRAPGRFIQPGQMTLINQAVLKQCVGQDGGAKTDQFLTDPRDCHFDPKVLQCTGGNVPPACLTAEQVTTMQNYYVGTIDPVNGQVINPGSERGNETDNVLALGLAFQEQLPEPAFDGLFYWVFGPSFGYPASAVNFANFDFHRDIDKVDDQLAAVLNANSTDLGEFRGAWRQAADVSRLGRPADPVAEQHQLLQRAGGQRRPDHGFQQASFGGHGNPALRADPELRPAVHGARDVSLLRRARPQHVRCAHPARQLGREGRGAGDDRRHQVRQRYAARGADDPAALRLSPRSRSTTEAAAPASRRISPASPTSTTSTRRRPPNTGHDQIRVMKRATPASPVLAGVLLLPGQFQSSPDYPGVNPNARSKRLA